MKLKEGDRVRFLSAEMHDSDPEYYPPVGTEGTIELIHEDADEGPERVALVRWHYAPYMDARWYAPYSALEVVR